MSDEPTLLGLPVRTAGALAGAGDVVLGDFSRYMPPPEAPSVFGNPDVELWWRDGGIKARSVVLSVVTASTWLTSAEFAHLEVLREFLR
jgi:hypothetical protein